MEGEALIIRKVDEVAYEILGGLRGQLIKGSYLARAQKSNLCSTLEDRNVIQEENKIIKTKV